MIPKIIHQTWKTTEIPENWKFGVDECKRIHKELERSCIKMNFVNVYLL
jgi:mannosyltransferase OCH1-like enzyme